ncbi:MAG: protein-tyrosine phosphatase family protein [Planctomycetota bacterium]
MRPTIYQIELIGSGFLAAMAKPASGEWIDEEFSGIAATGISQVISLLEQWEAREVGLAEEQQLCERHGMRFVSHPIEDRGLPQSVADFASFTKSLYHEIAGGRSTVVHCRAGIGRTGLVAGGVLLHAGFEPDEAIGHISKHRGVEVPDTEEQKDWLIINSRSIIEANS